MKNTNNIKIIYLWYWHLNPEIDTREVERSIRNHDWKTFKKWLKWQKKQNLIYLPDKADVYINEEYIGQVTINENTFKLITDNDYECC